MQDLSLDHLHVNSSSSEEMPCRAKDLLRQRPSSMRFSRHTYTVSIQIHSCFMLHILERNVISKIWGLVNKLRMTVHLEMWSYKHMCYPCLWFFFSKKEIYISIRKRHKAIHTRYTRYTTYPLFFSKF